MDNVMEILDMMQFFGGQRAGRELWADKPMDVQNADIEAFNNNIEAIREYIRQLENENAKLLKMLDVVSNRAARIEGAALHSVDQMADKLPRWISVKERLPEEGELVVFISTINQGSIYVGKLSHTGARGGVLFENRQGRTTMKYYAKYWMPLPEPPEEE